MLAISVVVPVRGSDENRALFFRRCVTALKRAAAPADEIIVVADGPAGPGLRRLVEECGIGLVQNEEPSGPAAARNRGAYVATGDVLFFVDADVVVPAGAVERVRRFFSKHPDFEALIGSYDDAPGDPHFLSQYRNLLHHYTHQKARPEASTFWGACGAVRRAAFFEAGGFDAERYRRPCVEDIELGYRLKAQGARIRLAKDLQVKHLKRWTPWRMVRTDVLSRGLPWTELLLQRGEVENDLNVDTKSRASVALAFLVVAALALSWWHLLFLAGAGVAAASLLLLHLPFYRFLAGKRSLRFAVRAVPWHGLLFLCSGIAFLLGVTRHVLGLTRPGTRRPSATSEYAS